MSTSLLLLAKFVYDIVKRLIHDAHYRSLGSALLLILLAGTLFLWLAEGRNFLHALTYSAMTMAMNSPYGFGWGPQTPGGLTELETAKTPNLDALAAANSSGVSAVISLPGCSPQR